MLMSIESIGFGLLLSISEIKKFFKCLTPKLIDHDRKT